jgi:hypothetical protein
MSYLEKLTLSLSIKNRSSFIDGTHLDKDILSNMSQLRTFIFDIVTEEVMINEEILPSSDDIRRTFIQRGYHVDCYIDYCPNEGSRCHIYSLPYIMDCLHYISNNFPGGVFMTVRRVNLYDTTRPFEHDFFVRLSQSFPLLKILSLTNTIKQKKKRSYQSNQYEQTSLIVKYPHLTDLYFGCVPIDYVEQFLIDSNTCLPCLRKIYIEYEKLFTVTENFTSKATRTTCSKLKDIIFEEGSIVCSKEFYLYFPLL